LSRLVLAALLLVLALPAAQAQESETEIVVDPMAIVDSMPRQGRLLTGLYATQATLEICNVTVPEPAATNMAGHRRQLETELHLDAPSAQKAYDTVKADVEKAGVDCAEGSSDRSQADAVIAIYAGGQ